jgi:hypothetical protein
MIFKKKWKESFLAGNYCFYCNVDSSELRLFLIIIIGGLVLASIFVAVGAYLRGSFRNVEEIKQKVLEAEGVEHD